jgi:hypothetical protein
MSPLTREGEALAKRSRPSAAQRRLAKAAAIRSATPAGRKARVPYSASVAERICKHLIAGKSLRSFCARKGNPNKSSVLRWLRENPAFRAQYARAREIQRHDLMDEILHIADTDPDPKRARIRIEARKWRFEKLVPKKYGKRE